MVVTRLFRLRTDGLTNGRSAVRPPADPDTLHSLMRVGSTSRALRTATVEDARHRACEGGDRFGQRRVVYLAARAPATGCVRPGGSRPGSLRAVPGSPSRHTGGVMARR